MTTASGATYGRVYLMYSNTTKKNCAVTLKSAYVGASTLTEVYIESKNGAVDGEFDHTHLYYANAYVYSPNDCVRYQGFIWSGATTSSTLAASALSGWHGCG
ncbi:MAG TPA: hypothetical protein VM677_18670 [Actinokineospora sp.]|nr:hypothetical protein [Actinokineospora sp.]